MLNKAKSFTTGYRRSFHCRVRSDLSNETKQTSKLKFIFKRFEMLKKDKIFFVHLIDYQVVQFAGYLRSDLNSNLKYTPPNQEDHNESLTKSSNKSNESIDANQILFKAHHSMSLFNNSYTNQPNSSSQSSLQNNFINSSIPLLQYYLIAYGQKKTMPDEEIDVQCKYVSRHDLDGKFIYVEPKYLYRLFYFFLL